MEKQHTREQEEATPPACSGKQLEGVDIRPRSDRMSQEKGTGAWLSKCLGTAGNPRPQVTPLDMEGPRSLPCLSCLAAEGPSHPAEE